MSSRETLSEQGQEVGMFLPWLQKSLEASTFPTHKIQMTSMCVRYHENAGSELEAEQSPLPGPRPRSTPALQLSGGTASHQLSPEHFARFRVVD